MEKAEHLRHVPEVRDTYKKRKETMERVFADVKERHCLSWIGKSQSASRSYFLLPQFEKVGKKKVPSFYIFLLPLLSLKEIKTKSPSQDIPKRALSTS